MIFIDVEVHLSDFNISEVRFSYVPTPIEAEPKQASLGGRAGGGVVFLRMENGERIAFFCFLCTPSSLFLSFHLFCFDIFQCYMWLKIHCWLHFAAEVLSSAYFTFELCEGHADLKLVNVVFFLLTRLLDFRFFSFVGGSVYNSNDGIRS